MHRSCAANAASARAGETHPVRARRMMDPGNQHCVKAGIPIEVLRAVGRIDRRDKIPSELKDCRQHSFSRCQSCLLMVGRVALAGPPSRQGEVGPTPRKAACAPPHRWWYA